MTNTYTPPRRGHDKSTVRCREDEGRQETQRVESHHSSPSKTSPARHDKHTRSHEPIQGNVTHVFFFFFQFLPGAPRMYRLEIFLAKKTNEEAT